MPMQAHSVRRPTSPAKTDLTRREQRASFPPSATSLRSIGTGRLICRTAGVFVRVFGLVFEIDDVVFAPSRSPNAISSATARQCRGHSLFKQLTTDHGPGTNQTTANGPRTASKSLILCLSSLLLRFRSLFDIVIPFVAIPAPTRAPSRTTRVCCVTDLLMATTKLAPSIAARSSGSAERTPSTAEPISRPHLVPLEFLLDERGLLLGPCQQVFPCVV